MAFQQTSASSQDDVIQQFFAFAVANAGFTDSGSDSPIPLSNYSQGRTMYRISKNGLTWALARTANTDSGIYMLLTYDSNVQVMNNRVAESAGRVSKCSFWNFAGPFTNVYMYTDGDGVFCCVELTSGIYTHMAIGTITKTETFDGGEFCAAMQGDSLIGSTYLNFRSAQQNPMFAGALTSGNITANAFYTAGGNSGVSDVIRATPESGVQTGYSRFAYFSRWENNNLASGEGMLGLSNDWSHNSYVGVTNFESNPQTQRTPMWPNIIRLMHQGNSSWRISGHTPAMRFCYMDFVSPGDIILNDWQVFPYSQKNGDGVQCPSAGAYGIAYKRA